MRNVVLIGFMGTGKTTTGTALAKTIGFSFHDLDEAVETESGMTIPQIFAEKGETYFRACEKQMVKKAAAMDRAVIATGGGTVKDEENVRALRETGIIVALTANVNTILQRTGTKGTRPVLDGEDGGNRKKAIEKLLFERRGLYAQADFSVDTSDRSAQEVADAIIETLKTRGEYDVGMA